MEPPILLVQVSVFDTSVEVLVSSQTAHATYTVNVRERSHGVKSTPVNLSLCEPFRAQKQAVMGVTTAITNPASLSFCHRYPPVPDDERHQVFQPSYELLVKLHQKSADGSNDRTDSVDLFPHESQILIRTDLPHRLRIQLQGRS